ncbi:hypothetical protein GCM10010169_63800 [Micromonospora fulviviridis]|uniref:hypothetical protein n=1 Tax=Micromonospora fulviviridis TaxID=47860 RepID=UPI0019B6D532|nr:hypothetical protein [Micromonospora fulviviridis]GGS10257.1 hypothetical protein GCM10010169_63800 [Micromonospora fulviviridis]
MSAVNIRRGRAAVNAGGVQVSKDGRSWRIGAAADVEWIAGHTTAGISITTAIPPIFDAYATTHQADGVTVAAYEHALVEDLITQTLLRPGHRTGRGLG